MYSYKSDNHEEEHVLSYDITINEQNFPFPSLPLSNFLGVLFLLSIMGAKSKIWLTNSLIFFAPRPHVFAKQMLV
jgi:hypothetical protein